MADGKTYLPGSEGDDGECAFSGYLSGMGRGVLNPSIVTRTPGPRATGLDTPQFTSTRYVDRAMPSHAEQNPDLGALITQLAEKLGDSIIARLQSDRSSPNTAPLQPSHTTLSDVNVVIQKDAREPPIFRGDSSDKFTVLEWENLMTLYLRKRNIPVHEQSGEIMAKLMGKAGDLVRIKLRNDRSIDHTTNPHRIFNILKQHFSEQSYSSMPLADFYNTLPKPDEDAMDYWIRLNKSVDVADECLKRQGRKIDDPGHEVSMMFVKHCPDQSLASVLKFKSADKWSACEIQERLDEHTQEKRTRVTAAVRSPESTASVHKVHSQSQISAVDSSFVPPISNTVPSITPHQSAPVVAGSDNDCMRSLVNLLDRLVMQNVQVPANSRTQQRFSQRPAAPQYRQPCRVCNDNDHSTLFHCRRENRCLKCLAPGHWKKECPQQTNQQHNLPTAGAGVGGPDQQLNC